MVAAWREGWKNSTTPLHRESTKPRVRPHLPHQVSILATWWEEWKVSTTLQLFSCSSFMILFYLLLIYYMLSESLLYTVPVSDMPNFSDLLSLQLFLSQQAQCEAR